MAHDTTSPGAAAAGSAGAAAAPGEHSTEVLLNLEDRNHFLRIAHEAQKEATNEPLGPNQPRKTGPGNHTAPSKNPM